MAPFFVALVAAAAVKFGAASEYQCEAPPGTDPGGIISVEGGFDSSSPGDWKAPVLVEEGMESNPRLRSYRLYNIPQFLIGGLYISSDTWPGRGPGRYQLMIKYTPPARIFIWTELGVNDGGLKALLDGDDNAGFEPVDLSGLQPFERRGNSGTDTLKLYSKLFLTGSVVFVGPLEGTTVAGIMSNCDIVSTTATTTTTSTTTVLTTTFTTTSSTMTSSTSTYTGTSSTRTTSTSTTVTSTTVTTSTTTTTTTTLHSVLQIDAVAFFKVTSPGARRLGSQGTKCSNLVDHFNDGVDPDGADQETVDTAFVSAVAENLVVVEPQMVYVISAFQSGEEVGVDFQIFVPFEPAYAADWGMGYWNRTRSTLEEAIRARVLRTYAEAECPAMEVSLGIPTFRVTWSDTLYDDLRTTTPEGPPSELDDGISLKAASGGLWALLGISLCLVGGVAWWWTGMLKKCFACLLEWKGREFFKKLGRKPTLDLEGMPDDEGMFDLPQTLEQTDSGHIHVKPIADIQREKKRKTEKSDDVSPNTTPKNGIGDMRTGRSMAFRSQTQGSGRLPVPSIFGAKGVVQTTDLGQPDPFGLAIEDRPEGAPQDSTHAQDEVADEVAGETDTARL